jgi:hypothetical protein
VQGAWERERDRDRETERQRDRETERQRVRESWRETDRWTLNTVEATVGFGIFNRPANPHTCTSHKLRTLDGPSRDTVTNLPEARHGTSMKGVLGTGGAVAVVDKKCVTVVL